MALRTCVKCKAADNPLGRLRFKKSRLDNEVYCENCDPNKAGVEAVSVPAHPSFAPPQTSAGLTVIPCPNCRGMSNKPHGKLCGGCSGYGSVRIPTSYLNVYRPSPVEPGILTEEALPK